ncbi:cell division protein ZapA [Desulfothermus okinawensis JCM 13304]
MPTYRLTILGQEVSFRANVDEARIQEAKKVVLDRFDKLNTFGSRLSNEKLLILVALGLADDLLQTKRKLQDTEIKLKQLLEKIEKK